MHLDVNIILTSNLQPSAFYSVIGFLLLKRPKNGRNLKTKLKYLRKMYTITLNVYLTLNYLCIKVYCFDLMFNMILLTDYVITIEVNLQYNGNP